MYARIGTAHCPECGREIRSQSIDQIVDALMAEGEGVKFTIFAPVIRGRKGTHEKVIGRIRKEGFTRVRIDEEIYRLDDDEISIEKTRKHNIDIVVDRVKVKEGVEGRLAPCLVSQSFAIVAESSCSPVERLLSARSSSAVSAAWTALIAWTALALRLSDTSGTTFCGRTRCWGSWRTTRPLSSMAGLEEIGRAHV